MDQELGHSKQCFIICPIGEPESDARRRSDQLMEFIIQPAVSTYGYKASRADLSPAPTLITPEVVENIINSPLVIADLTDANPNVFYELALRHVTNKPLIAVRMAGTKIPFDVKDFRAIEYVLNDPSKLKESTDNLRRQVEAIEQGQRFYNPISFALTALAARSSEDPTTQSFAQIMEILQEIRQEITTVLPEPKRGYSYVPVEDPILDLTEGDIVRHALSSEATVIGIRYDENAEQIVTLKLKSGRIVRMQYKPGQLSTC